ncbi:MAG: SBBP repeat-containing protein [Elusimicrobia bacterium]|nr:SBBP repeat-containing protein [Elusimicrobiota bacterium]
MNKDLETKMNFIPRMSRLIVAATLMAGSPGSVFAASAMAPAFTGKGGTAIPLAGAKGPNLAAYSNLPLFFEKNHGQTDASVKFFTRAAGYSLYLTGTEAVMVMPRAKAAKTKAAVVVRMKLKGANAQAPVQGRNILPGHTSYMRGNDRSKWQIGVEQYAEVKFSSVYPGIDVVYYGKMGDVEHDFIVAPGANPGRILVGFEGAKSLRLDPRGNLILGVEDGEVAYQAPTLFQMVGGKRKHVNGRFVLAGKNQVRIEVGDYSKSLELVIEPALAYSNFLGGAGATEDQAFAIAVDNAGNAYLTGTTNSADFPVGTPPPGGSPIQAIKGAGYDLFVTKVNPAGTQILWSTYLGGATNEAGLGIVVGGASGKAYITGSIAGGANLPGSVPLTGAVGVLTGINAFAVGFAADGKSTTFNVTFGGDGDDIGRGIAIDSAENIYITGETTTLALNTFPTMGAAQPLAGGGASQGFVMKFNSSGVQQFGAYLGGTGFTVGRAIAVDGLNGSVYVTGNTGAGFPVTLGAFKGTYGGAGGSAEGDAFVARMTPTGTSYDYMTYVGGAIDDEGTGIAVDSLKDVYITGYTFSPDFPDNSVAFPTVAGQGGGRTTLSTAPDAFVFKLRIGNGGAHADGVYATFLGGGTDDRGTGITVDSTFHAYVAGTTTSGDFPSVGANAGAGQASFIGTPEAFVTEFDITGGPLILSTWLGGVNATNGQGLALDTGKNIYVTGFTASGAGTFPLVAGGFQQLRGTGTNTAFVTKFGSAPLAVPPVPPVAGTSACNDGFFYPSPATGPTGTFSYCMESAGAVKIRVYNVIGDLAVKIDDTKPAGAQLSTVDTARLASGVYLYILERDYGAGNKARSRVKKFVVKH